MAIQTGRQADGASGVGDMLCWQGRGDSARKFAKLSNPEQYGDKRKSTLSATGQAKPVVAPFPPSSLAMHRGIEEVEGVTDWIPFYWPHSVFPVLHGRIRAVQQAPVWTGQPRRP
ncbi:hypothetical protein AAE478_009505 [Parahypoxylon ruwenzoriense]